MKYVELLNEVISKCNGLIITDTKSGWVQHVYIRFDDVLILSAQYMANTQEQMKDTQESVYKDLFHDFMNAGIRELLDRQGLLNSGC